MMLDNKGIKQTQNIPPGGRVKRVRCKGVFGTQIEQDLTGESVRWEKDLWKVSTF